MTRPSSDSLYNIDIIPRYIISTDEDPSLRIESSAIINLRGVSTDEDPSLRIESSAIINLRGVSTKLNKYVVFTMQTYNEQTLTLIAISLSNNPSHKII